MTFMSEGKAWETAENFPGAIATQLRDLDGTTKNIWLITKEGKSLRIGGKFK